MRNWLNCLKCLMVMLLGLTSSVAARAEDNPLEKPILLVQLQSIEEILNRAEYIAGLAGKEEEGKQVLGLVRSMAGAKGLEGVDIKKPFLVYAGVSSDGQTMPFAVMLPIADEASFQTMLSNRLGIEPKKDKEGILTFSIPNVPVEVHARFANGYLYVSAPDKNNLSSKLLPKPEQILLKDSSLISVSVQPSNIPDMLKKLFLGQFETALAEAKKKKEPNETPEMHKLKEQAIDQVTASVKQFLNEAQAVRLKLDADSKTDDLSLAFEIEPLKDSALAKYAGSLKNKLSWSGAAVDSKSPIYFNMNFTLPDVLKEAVSLGMDKAMADALQKGPPEQRMEAEKIFKAVMPTLKSGIVDWAIGVQPTSDGKLTASFAIKTINGKEIEAALKEAAAKAPADVRSLVNLDAEKVGDVNLHELKVGSSLDANAKRVLGESSLWFAFKNDFLIASIGPDANKAVKAALGAQAVEAVPMKLEVGVKALVRTFEKETERKAAEKFAKEVFDQKPGSDKISLNFEGGDKIRLKFSMKGTLIKFFVKMSTVGKVD
ncbi:hypothetical protein KIH39_07325 [Telmatocola sphagniphila]|uniref:Uncharacterized protein n=1 Tax=Telmatocola sphagniphila TaxID=1123043 RepID=A0A8E6BB48_9BACT|nr:hypothetical protein [Telmatocola sphagniphila]QVL33710.1 hypothetical protein KIH39_07325 [Telmatocola sphagniphila]